MELMIKEAAETAGVSVRTLHHWDSIGLLKPAKILENGYRSYSEEDMNRLQQIMFFRELDFSLSDIRRILEDPAFDRMGALHAQQSLLLKKRKRLNAIITSLEETINAEQEGRNMSNKQKFNAFDMSEIEKHRDEYADEVKARYGGTVSYEESIKRTSSYTEEDWRMIQKEAMLIYKKFASLMQQDAADPEDVLEAVREWQGHISRHYYECTDEILRGLGEMYKADERFRKNIDKTADGLAAFMSEAISEYCRS